MLRCEPRDTMTLARMTRRVVVVDGSTVGRESKVARAVGLSGLAQLPEILEILAGNDFEVVGEHDDGDTAPDVYLVGVVGREGRALLASAAADAGEIPVVAIVDSADPGDLAACLADGARAVVGPSMGAEEAFSVIDQACRGVTCLPTEALMETIQLARSQPSADLSPVELEMLSAMVEGMSVTDLARSMHHSTRTMTRLLRKLYDKLGVGNRRQAIEWAVREGVGVDRADPESAPA